MFLKLQTVIKMDRHHELLQTAEVYSHCIDMIQKTVVGIRHEIAPIKKFIGDRKKEIIKFRFV